MLFQIKIKCRLCTGKSYLKKAHFFSDIEGVEVGEDRSRIIGYEYFIHEGVFSVKIRRQRQKWMKIALGHQERKKKNPQHACLPSNFYCGKRKWR